MEAPRADITDSDLVRRHDRRAAVAVWILILVALVGLRAYHWNVAVAISPDSAMFVDIAQRLDQQWFGAPRAAPDFAAALAEEGAGATIAYRQHPLYSVSLLLVHKLLEPVLPAGGAGWILAGRIAALLGSLLAVVALYWLTRMIYSPATARPAALLFALLPDATAFGADVLTDSVHIGWYVLGLAFVLASVQQRRWWLAAVGCGAGALAFLTRPEGGAVLPVALALIWWSKPVAWRGRLGWSLACVAVFFAVAAPYQLATGELVPKKSLDKLLSFGCAPAMVVDAGAVADHSQGDPSDRVVRHGDVANGNGPVVAASLSQHASVLGQAPLPPLDVLRQWFRAGRVTFVVFAVIGLVVARPRGDGARLLLLALGLHVFLLNALAFSFDYLDRRHAFILVVLSLPTAAAGMRWIADRLATRQGVVRWHTLAVCIAICLATTGYWLLRPVNYEEIHIRDGARWIADNTPRGSLLVGDRRLHRVALVADRPFVEWRWWSGEPKYAQRLFAALDKLSPELERGFADAPRRVYLIVDAGHMTHKSRNPDFFADLETVFGEELTLVAEIPAPDVGDGTSLRVYRRRP